MTLVKELLVSNQELRNQIAEATNKINQTEAEFKVVMVSKGFQRINFRDGEPGSARINLHSDLLKLGIFPWLI
jgi:hypothetical protein